MVPRDVPPNSRRHRGIAPIAAGAPLGAVGVTGCTNCRQGNCFRSSSDAAGSRVEHNHRTMSLAAAAFPILPSLKWSSNGGYPSFRRWDFLTIRGKSDDKALQLR